MFSNSDNHPGVLMSCAPHTGNDWALSLADGVMEDLCVLELVCVRAGQGWGWMSVECVCL